MRYVMRNDPADFQREWAQEIEQPTTLKTAIVSPPESGKTTWVAAAAAWIIGNNPNVHLGYIGNTARQAERQSIIIRDTIASNERFRQLFPEVRLDDTRARRQNEWFVTRDSVFDKDATLQITGYGGPILGARLDIAIIDDYSDSENTDTVFQAEKAYEWLLANVITRLNPDTGRVLIIQTRWGPQDVIGHLKRADIGLKILHCPALYRWKQGQRVPAEDGQVLWGARWSRAGVLQRRKELGSRLFGLHYQGDDTAIEGMMFQRPWFKIVRAYPTRARAIRYWDRASSTSITADYTVGMLVAEQDGVYYVVDVVRGQWSPLQCEQIIQQTAIADRTRGFGRYDIYMEQEPGSSGLDVIDHYAREVLKGFSFRGHPKSANKEEMANPASAAAEAGNILLVEKEEGTATWIPDLLDELAIFPNGVHDDQVDTLSGAVNRFGEVKVTPLVGAGGNTGKSTWAVGGDN